MLVPSGMTLCQPQSMAYCTDGSRKLLEANFNMVSIPSSLTSALSSCNQKGNVCQACSPAPMEEIALYLTATKTFEGG